MPLLLFGLVLVGLAQMGLFFSVDLNARAPTGYLLMLALGFALFTLGSMGLWLHRRSTPGATGPEILSALPALTTRLRTPVGAGGMVVGIAAMVVLLAMLAAGSESASAIIFWVVARVAFSGPFWPLFPVAPLLIVSLPGRWLRSHSWDLLIVATLIGVFIAINAHDLRDWYYSAIGDEFLFYEHAKRIEDEGIVRPFSQEGVYNKHPVLNSVFQATVMRIFGDDYFGWTFSELLNAALTIPAIYLLGRVLGGRTAAIAAAAIFAFSHYVFAFSHTGYNNLSSLPVSAWSLAFFVLGWRNGNPLLLYAAGIIAGLGFYTHYSGRAILPVIILFSLTMGSPKRLLNLWPLALGFAIAILPTFVVEQEHVLTRMFGQVIGGYTEEVTGSLGQRLLDNASLNLPAFSYNATVHAYVYGPLMDPVSGFLAVLGLAFAIGHVRQSGYRLLLIWFAVAMFMTGIMSPYPHVAITRLLFVVPPLALLAGLAVGRSLEYLPVPKWRPPGHLPSLRATCVLAVLLPVILVLNLWQFWHLTPSVFPHSQEAVALGAFRSDDCGGDPARTVFVGHAVGDGSLMQQVLHSMDPNGARPKGIDHLELSQGTALPDPMSTCVVFVNPDTAESHRLQEELAHRYPDGRSIAFSNPSGINTVEIFSIE